MSRAQHICQLLEEGPATAAEIAAELGIKVTLASAHMADLRRKGRVTSRPFRDINAHRQVVNLYSLVAA